MVSSLYKGLSFQKFKIDFWRKEVKNFLVNQETDSFDEMYRIRRGVGENSTWDTMTVL